MDLNLVVKLNFDIGVFHLIVGLLFRWKLTPISLLWLIE